ncbi:MAG: tRNA (N6-isopentenyl adenosine(37)-C2)-methylthiotransferase MiaB [Pyrinomonadaceae bacterium]
MKVYLETFGCQMNVSDTERAATQFRAAGYDLIDHESGADVVIFNTCSIRERAAQKLYTRVGEIVHRHVGPLPVIGVTGCVAQLEGEAIFKQSPSVKVVAGTRATDRLPDLISRALEGERRVLDLGEREPGESWDVSIVERHSAQVGFVPIIEGCNKFCSYCIVPYSRGRERSRSAAEIWDEVIKLRDNGFKEIHLIGQNVNSYRPQTEAGMEGIAGSTPFSRLLRMVAKTGIERIKFTTSFPRDFHPDIVAALNDHENLCNWVHLPAQSGNDRVLRAMRRGYTRADYLRRIESINNCRRKVSITSDLIVGYPGETEAEFADTMSLVEQCRYEGLYIFKYSERAGTPSAKIADDVTKEQKTIRYMALERLQRSIQTPIYQSLVGKTFEVLAEGRSTKNPTDLTGHTTCHKVVNFAAPPSLIGEVVKVVIETAKPNSLLGRLVA